MKFPKRLLASLGSLIGLLLAGGAYWKL